MISETRLNIDIKEYLDNKKSLIDSHLKKTFDPDFYVKPSELWNAIRYSLLNGGKRIRGILCIATYESLIDLCGNNQPKNFEDHITTACAIEIIHAMSLIHDDLPCMDNDDLRRGKPSCHKAFSESTAILAGDAMLGLAIQQIIENTKYISGIQKLKLINLLTKSFSFGLVPGQILDLSVTGKSCNLNFLKEISMLKTAELIKASVICGGIIAIRNQDNDLIENLSSYGLNLGIAFQIVDDILDVTSDTKTLGKTSGKDEKQKKPTYPAIIGIEKSKELSFDLIMKAKSYLQNTDLIKSQILLSIADYITSRVN
ncbi:MAG: polyprenyl synthetase family protein [Candidatus Melainabacteria bacterium]|nr:polyprenyl synthetase family protein [Candidatus Melainabacteria bacterium]